MKEVLESPDLIPSCKLKVQFFISGFLSSCFFVSQVPLEVRVTVGDNWAAVSSH